MKVKRIVMSLALLGLIAFSKEAWAEEVLLQAQSEVENLDADFYLPAITPEAEGQIKTSEGALVIDRNSEESQEVEETQKESLKEANPNQALTKAPSPSRQSEMKLRQLKYRLINYLRANKNPIAQDLEAKPIKTTEENNLPKPMPPLNFTKKGMYALTVQKTNLTSLDERPLVLGANKVVKVLEKHEGKYLVEYEDLKGYIDEPLLKGYTPEAFGKVVNEVPYISQLYPVYAPNGCEPTAMLMGLKAKGYTDIDLKTYLDKMPKDASNPSRGYVGVPYNTEYHRFQTIDPEPLAAYGRTYGARTKSLQGEPIESVIKEVQNGNTVVLWATLYWQKPQYSTLKIDGVPKRHIFNNHVILVTGYDPIKKAFYIADPYNHEGVGANRKKPYYYWKDLKEVDEAYNYDNRRFAVAVR